MQMPMGLICQGFSLLLFACIGCNGGKASGSDTLQSTLADTAITVSQSIDSTPAPADKRFIKQDWKDLAQLAGMERVTRKDSALLEGLLHAERFSIRAKDYSFYRQDSTATGNSFEIVAPILPFDSVKNKANVVFDRGVQTVVEVNGIPCFGTSSDLPKTQFGSITISRNEKAVPFPRKAYYDLFNPGYEIRFYESIENPVRWYLEMWGSDGEGGYLVLWIFEGNNYKHRIVANAF